MIKIVIEKIFQIAILTCAALLLDCTSSARKVEEESPEAQKVASCTTKAPAYSTLELN
ncbi:MAG: hypothetical protein J6X67_11275 [Treponema sp.]|nr:hypothetical protein [Treponema sp.]